MLYITGKIDFVTGKSKSRKIFILGTGRSGTHWIAYILDAHPQIRATIEKNPMFGLVKEMALDPSKRARLFPKLIRRYKLEHFISAPLHYLDKSHPNIWLAEDLSKVFKDAVFIGMKRNPYATIASMLKHKGVKTWHKDWKQYPIPNAFLGITEEIATHYDNLPLVTQFAFRWKAHQEQMNKLQENLHNRLLVINYEELIFNIRENLNKLEDFLELKEPIPIPEIRSESLDKWKKQLDDSEIKQIAEIVGYLPSDETMF